MGEDAKYLTDGEEIGSQELFNTLNSKKVYSGEEEETSELKYLEIMRGLRDSNPDLFEKIEIGQKGDIVLFTGINGIVDHIGILISSEKFLHSVRNIGVVISPFNQLYSRKLYGFYRIKCEKQSK